MDLDWQRAHTLQFVNMGVGVGILGCGKSTLLAGLDQPSKGEVHWAGTPGRIGYVLQDPTLLPWASAAENVRLPLRLGGRTETGGCRRLRVGAGLPHPGGGYRLQTARMFAALMLLPVAGIAINAALGTAQGWLLRLMGTAT